MSQVANEINDADGDGILDTFDLCVEYPETENDFQDEDGCPDDLGNSTAEELNRFYEQVKAIPPQFDMPYVLGIPFTQEYKLYYQGYDKLQNLIADLLEYPDQKIIITGYTWEDNENSVDISIRMANTVKEILLDGGILETRLIIKGVGGAKLISMNDTFYGRAKNTRVEIRKADSL